MPRCDSCGKPITVRVGKIQRHIHGETGKRCPALGIMGAVKKVSSIIGGDYHKIDWEELQMFLGTAEEAPEGIVHEIAHAYDCIGIKAFDGKIGNSKAVATLIKTKYRLQSKLENAIAELAEIRASTVTFMVLESLGLSDLKTIINAIEQNISAENRNLVKSCFFTFLYCYDVIEDYKRIKQFCLKFAIDD